MDHVPLIRPILVTGANVNCRGNWQFGYDDKVVTSFGKCVTLVEGNTYSLKDMVKFTWENIEINRLAVSEDRKIMAVAFKSVQPFIAAFDVTKSKVPTVLSIPLANIKSKEIIILEVSYDNKYILAVLGAPDWLLLSYRWEKGELKNYTKAVFSVKENIVTSATFNIFDRRTVLITGRHMYKQMTIKKGSWGEYGYHCTDKVTFTSACWLTVKDAILGTEDGRLVIISTNKILDVYSACTTKNFSFPEIDPKLKKDTNAITLEPLETNEYEYIKEVDNLTRYKELLAFSFGKNEIFLFTQRGPREWQLEYIFMLNADPDVYSIISDSTHSFVKISINLKKDQILASMTDGRAFYAAIKSKQDEQPKSIILSLYGPSINHVGEIRDVATCLWKPIYITVGGKDRLCKLWDYKLKTPMITEHIKEGIYSVSIHPSGLYCLLGLKYYLKLAILCFDGFRKFKTYETIRCRVSAFSESGSLFAYTVESFNENSICIVTTDTLNQIYKFENIILMAKGQLKVINEDTLINQIYGFYTVNQVITRGMDGPNMYTFKVPTAKDRHMYDNIQLIQENYLAEFVYDLETKTYRFYRECLLPILENNISAAYPSELRRFLVIAFDDGRIMTTPNPPISPFTWTLVNLHAKAVTKIVTTDNDHTLATIDKGGIFVVWRLGNLYTDKLKILHLPLKKLAMFYAIEDNHELFSKKEIFVEDSEKCEQLFMHRIQVAMIEPIKEHYEYILQEFNRKLKSQEIIKEIYYNQKIYYKTLQVNQLGIEALRLLKDAQKKLLKNILNLEEYKKLNFEREKFCKNHHQALLNSIQCFAQFFTQKNIYKTFIDELSSQWSHAVRNYETIQHEIFRHGEQMCQQIYIDMKKDFIAKLNVLENLECYLKSQMAVLLFFKKEVIKRVLKELVTMEQEIKWHFFLVSLDVNITKRLEDVNMRKKVLQNIEMFRKIKRNIASKHLKTITNDFHLRRKFRKFKPDYWSFKLNHYDAMMDSNWLKEWRMFKVIYNEYMFMRSCSEDLQRRAKKIKKKIPKLAKSGTKRSRSKVRMHKDNQIFSDLFRLTRTDIKQKNENVYELLETALCLNPNLNINNKYVIKLLVMTACNPKDMLSKDLIYNLETYDICMKLINQKEEFVDQKVGAKEN